MTAIKIIETNVFDSMIDDYLTRDYKIDGIKHFKIFHIESVDNNILTGELFQSVDGKYLPEIKVDALKLRAASKLGFKKSSDLDIFTFNLWKGIVSDEDLKMYGKGRKLPPFSKSAKGDGDEKNKS